MGRYTIELDCPPGNPRPKNLIDDVLKDTGITVSKEVSTLFGCAEFVIPSEFEEKFKEHRELIKERVTRLYEQGFIRYGSW